jgi:thioredoxin reductase (NADPH)
MSLVETRGYQMFPVLDAEQVETAKRFASGPARNFAPSIRALMVGSAEIGETLMRAFILLGLIQEGEKGGRVSSVLVGISASAELGRLEGEARLRRHRQRVLRFAEARAQEWQIHSALAD